MGAGAVIVGAGQAGAAAAAKLRQAGYRGTLTLLGDEGFAPYQRPPLSKAYLTGRLQPDRMPLRGTEFWADRGIDLRPDERAEAIDRARRVVVTVRGTLAYDHLILATGAVPLRLPDPMTAGVANVFTLRGMADADRLRPHLRPGARLLVVGGGYVGLEVAAAARATGAEVTLLEMAPRILNRVAAEPTATHLRALHRAQGVTIREGVALAALEQGAGRITARLSDSAIVLADAVVVGVGVRPDTALAAGAGLATDGGIVVDAFGRTEDPAIWAAGDCAVFPHEDGMLRLESVPHAIDHAEHVAQNILGAAKSYVARPWFWSDQFDTKLQIAGLNRGHTRIETRDGPSEGGLSVWYYRGDRLLAADCLNDPRSFMTARRMLAA